MRNQILSMKLNWCAGKRGEDELENTKMNGKIIKQQCSLKMQHENQSSSASSWSDLDMDLLREINKKISNYADHIRFRRVCKSWRSVGSDEKRAGDVLPWLMGLCGVSKTGFSYRLHEPPFKYDTGSSMHGLINLCGYFNDDTSEEEEEEDSNNSGTRTSHRYADGWLYICVYNLKSNTSNLLLFSLTNKASFTLPPFNHHYNRKRPLYLAWSTTPDSPDCVFFAMSITDPITRTIGIFRHGDTHWTTTQSVGGLVYGKLIIDDFVFIRGVFYFIITYRAKIEIEIESPAGIGFYDLATGALNFEDFSTNLMFYKAQNLFRLDGDLMLAYFELETQKFCIRKYDWSNKDWVPLQSLGGRSLYLSTHSVYVDQINYYSANKIYVYVGNDETCCVDEYTLVGNDETCCVDEYTLEDDGQLSKCTSTRLRRWFEPWIIWVPPPDLRLRR